MKKNNILKTQSLKSQQGVSLLQMVGVIIVGAILTSGSIAMWKQTSGGSKESGAVNQIIAIQMSYRGAYSGQSTYGTGDITNPKNMPSDLKVSGTTVTNSWNGTVTVTGSSSNFYQTWTSIPDENCPKLAITKSDWQSVSINGTSQSLPVTTAAAQSACTAGTNTIIFTSN